MYSVVCFIKENTVDAVPSHWMKNNLCAWPKKHIKKCIERKLQPNDVDYDYFPARVMKKHISSLKEARAKAKLAEHTSDLDHEVIKKQLRNRDGTTRLVEIANPPTYQPNENKIDCDSKNAVNEDSDDKSSRDASFQLPVRNDLFSVSPTSSEKLENVSSYNLYQKPVINHNSISSKDDNILNKRARRHLDFEDKYDKFLDQKSSNITPSASLISHHIEEPHKYIIPRSKTSEVRYIHTLSSPFKVTNDDVSHSQRMEEFQTSASNINTKIQHENNYKSKETITSVHKRSNENEQNATKRNNALEYSIPRSKTSEVRYIHTLSSPFKVTNDDVSHSRRMEEFQTRESNIKNNRKLNETTTSMNKILNENADNATRRFSTLEYSVPRSTNEGDYIYTQTSPFKVTPKVTQPTDMMQKILRAVLKTKDYVEANGERLDKIESFLYNSTSRSQNMNTNSYGVETENIYSEYFPIQNEESLDEFERKLGERAFRSTVINEIKHYCKKDLVPTVREILRQMFHDELLKHYSYVGQKGKKNFSSLASCTVLIEAVKKMNSHKDATNAQIAAPIKTFLSGAPSRLCEKSKLNPDKM